jgi:hypothetical protein
MLSLSSTPFGRAAVLRSASLLAFILAAPEFDEDRTDVKSSFAPKVRYIKDGAAKEFIIGVKVRARKDRQSRV